MVQSQANGGPLDIPALPTLQVKSGVHIRQATNGLLREDSMIMNLRETLKPPITWILLVKNVLRGNCKLFLLLLTSCFGFTWLLKVLSAFVFLVIFVLLISY